MGYTHYWTQTDTMAPAAWIEFADGCKRVIALVQESGVVLGDWSGDGGKPEVKGAYVSFNGVGEGGHETFRVTRKLDGDRGGFCKTARKPYDLAVTAILAYLDSVEPGAFTVTTDGRLPNWRDGLALARKAWPDKANVLDFPREVRDRARYDSTLDSSAEYLAYVGHDGVSYIEDNTTRDRRRLPDTMQGAAAYAEWVRTVPHTMRKWGSFKGDHAACESRRLAEVWRLSEGATVPPLVYDSILHGMAEPETTHA